MLRPTALCICALLGALLLAPATASPRPLDNETDTDLTPTLTVKTSIKSCTWKNMTGECVLESYCSDQHDIEEGGVIDLSELRTYGCDISKNEWCCIRKKELPINGTSAVTDGSIPTVTEGPLVTPGPRGPSKPPITEAPPLITPVAQGCAVTMSPNCPWCVKLYRSGSDPFRQASGFFCMGTMVGSRVVLTAATCVLQSAKKDMWARIPTSVDPNENHVVTYKQLHPQYNSGTREYDMALLTFENDVKWNNNLPSGACIGLKSNLQHECVGAGIDSEENIDMTPLFVNKGGCGMGGSVTDAACGRVDDIDFCSVITGAPVMCRADGGAYIMVGIVRMPCIPINDGTGQAGSLLGSVNLASAWLERELQGTFSLRQSDYLRSDN